MWQDNPREKLTVFHVSTVSRQNNEICYSKFPISILTHLLLMIHKQQKESWAFSAPGLCYEHFFPLKKPKQKAKLSRKGAVLRFKRKGNGLTRHWNKEGMAVTNDSHVAHSEAESGYFIDKQSMNAKEPQKVPVTVWGRPVTSKQNLLPRAVASIMDETPEQ